MCRSALDPYLELFKEEKAHRRMQSRKRYEDALGKAILFAFCAFYIFVVILMETYFRCDYDKFRLLFFVLFISDRKAIKLKKKHRNEKLYLCAQPKLSEKNYVN